MCVNRYFSKNTLTRIFVFDIMKPTINGCCPADKRKETTMAKRFGVMLDMSRNAVMKPEQVKEFAKTIKSFGYEGVYNLV